MENPLRKQHYIELEGVKYALRLERYDFALAQRDLGVPFFPYGGTPTWEAINRILKAAEAGAGPDELRILDNDPEITLAVYNLLYAALVRSVKGLTIDWIADRVGEENMGDALEALFPALGDFFLRLHAISEKATAETQTSQSAPTNISTGSVDGTGPNSASANGNSGASRRATTKPTSRRGANAST